MPGYRFFRLFRSASRSVLPNFPRVCRKLVLVVLIESGSILQAAALQPRQAQGTNRATGDPDDRGPDRDRSGKSRCYFKSIEPLRLTVRRLSQLKLLGLRSRVVAHARRARSGTRSHGGCPLSGSSASGRVPRATPPPRPPCPRPSRRLSVDLRHLIILLSEGFDELVTACTYDRGRESGVRMEQRRDGARRPRSRRRRGTLERHASRTP